MKLWLIQRTDEVDYGEGIAFVVRAATEVEARELAANQIDNQWRESRETWTNPTLSICTELSQEGPSEIILAAGKGG